MDMASTNASLPPEERDKYAIFMLIIHFLCHRHPKNLFSYKITIPHRYYRMIKKLRHALDLLIDDPNTTISEELLVLDWGNVEGPSVEEVNALPEPKHDVQGEWTIG